MSWQLLRTLLGVSSGLQLDLLAYTCRKAIMMDACWKYYDYSHIRATSTGQGQGQGVSCRVPRSWAEYRENGTRLGCCARYCYHPNMYDPRCLKNIKSKYSSTMLNVLIDKRLLLLLFPNPKTKTKKQLLESRICKGKYDDCTGYSLWIIFYKS